MITKTAQFTPGPWNARRNHAETTESERINITAGSVLIAETHHAWIDWEEQEANAALIAAAPAMYEALQIMVRAANVDEIDPLVMFASIERARHVLKLAEGKSA